MDRYPQLEPQALAMTEVAASGVCLQAEEALPTGYATGERRDAGASVRGGLCGRRLQAMSEGPGRG